MKNVFKLMVWSLSVFTAAGANAVKAEEKVYIFQNTTVETLSILDAPAKVLEYCNFAWAYGTEPEFPIFTTIYSVNKGDLYSIQTQSAQGRVVNDSVKKVGESIACTGDMTQTEIQAPVYIGAQEFRTGPFSAQVNQATKIELKGQTYFANGSARFRTPFEGGIPYPGFALIGATATLHILMGDGYEGVGSYTANSAIPAPGLSTDESAGGVVVMRISDSGYPIPPIAK